MTNKEMLEGTVKSMLAEMEIDRDTIDVPEVAKLLGKLLGLHVCECCGGGMVSLDGVIGQWRCCDFNCSKHGIDTATIATSDVVFVEACK